MIATKYWCWYFQVAEVELRNSTLCPGTKERVTYYKYVRHFFKHRISVKFLDICKITHYMLLSTIQLAHRTIHKCKTTNNMKQISMAGQGWECSRGFSWRGRTARRGAQNYEGLPFLIYVHIIFVLIAEDEQFLNWKLSDEHGEPDWWNYPETSSKLQRAGGSNTYPINQVSWLFLHIKWH